MRTSRPTSVLLLTAVSSLTALPVSAGQVAHHSLAHGGVSAPAHHVRVVHRSRVTHVHLVPRVARTPVVAPHIDVAPGVSIIRRPTIGAPAVVQAEPTHRWGTSIAASSAILTSPSPDAKVIKHIPAGTHVPDIIGEENGYYQYIRWTHKIAYVAKNEVELGSGTPVAEASHGGEPGQ